MCGGGAARSGQLEKFRDEVQHELSVIREGRKRLPWKGLAFHEKEFVCLPPKDMGKHQNF